MKRWNDIQILRLIDEAEESAPAALSSGLQLLDHARLGTAEYDQQRDPPTFVRELLLAREAGLLSWDDRAQDQWMANPVSDAYQWLQQIRDLSLTIAGRDRARGREVISELPDPDQDDGRMISGQVLEEIAGSIAEVFTPSQLPRFLLESGMPPQFVNIDASGEKWEYIHSVLIGLDDGGSAARRVLRTFIGAWLSDCLHESPSDRSRRKIVDRLRRQGWYVQDDVLVIGEKTKADVSILAPMDKDARIASLHPDIRQAAGKYLDGDHPEVAIFESFKLLTLRVKKMTGIDDDGQSLMGKAMSSEKPGISFGDLSTETGRGLQSGMRFLFMGAVSAIRNPDAHEPFRPLSDEEAFEELSFASMLMRRLDAAVVHR
jgi:uncharacterized protein (TIGR02391 family)